MVRLEPWKRRPLRSLKVTPPPTADHDSARPGLALPVWGSRCTRVSQIIELTSSPGGLDANVGSMAPGAVMPTVSTPPRRAPAGAAGDASRSGPVAEQAVD